VPRAGIAKATPHAFRHTFASWLVQAGVSTFVVGKLLGHRDSKMVERVYGHLKPQTYADAVAMLPRFPELLAKPPKQIAAGTDEQPAVVTESVVQPSCDTDTTACQPIACDTYVITPAAQERS
jgi:hypothetical protein